MKYFTTILFILFTFCTEAQRISGVVFNEEKEGLTGATIYWIGSDTAVITGVYGDFQISATGVFNKLLIASFNGLSSDTIEIKNQRYLEFTLYKSRELDEVIVQEQKDGVIISSLNPIKTEKITQNELRKAACCDLAGCFETQTTVQPQTTNIITNSKELRILGLSGVYNQVLIDGFPLIQGLSYTYGISSIPGTIVDNIYVAKGANSVLQGFESISGQINVETKEPDKTEKLYLNVYMNNFLEKHVGANYAVKKEKWSNLTTIHTIFPAEKTDKDFDNFLDLPLLSRVMVSNKWKYGHDNDIGFNSRIGVRFFTEKRIGGQVSFNSQTDKGSAMVYGQVVEINQPEIWTKAGYRIHNNHNIVLFASSYRHNQNSYFGTTHYTATQNNFYGNIQYEFNYANNDVKTGFSFRHLWLDENIAFTDNTLKRSYAGNYKRKENIPGFFAENTLRLLNNSLTWILGVRGDQHNVFGFQFTPRTLLKYDLAPQSIVRANIGTGWRTVNLFSENIGILVSSRDIVFLETLKPEKAMNYGINLTQKFETQNGNLSGYLSVDFYHTKFQNQIFPDYDSNPQKVIIQNFEGKSISNGFQSEIFFKMFKVFELKTGFNLLDVYRIEGDQKQPLPFNSRHKILVSSSYKPTSNQFHLDVNLHWYGRQRLPNTRSNPIEYQRPDFSEPYTIINAQLTVLVSKFEIYGGCENIFNFRQEQPIISWQQPFSPYFDTSSVWGPTRGREIYFGVRYKMASE